MHDEGKDVILLLRFLQLLVLWDDDQDDDFIAEFSWSIMEDNGLISFFLNCLIMYYSDFIDFCLDF